MALTVVVPEPPQDDADTAATDTPAEDVHKGLLAVPASPPRNVMWTVASFVLFLNCVDALTFYGVSQAFKNFMEDSLGYSKVSASAVRSTWTSFCDIVPLFGAYVGDELWGRYPTIVFFAFWYVASTGLLSFSAHPYILEHYKSVANVCFLVSLFGGIGLSNGSFGPNIVTFGADQFSHSDTDHAQKQLFFSHFYMSINVGSSFSYAYLAYLSVNGMGEWIPQQYGYFATFTLCTVLMLLANLLFVSASSRYVKHPPQHHSFTELFKTLVTSISHCPDLAFVVGGFGLFLLSFCLNVVAVALDPNGSIAVVLTYAAGGSVFLGVCCWLFKGMEPDYLDSHPTLAPQTIQDLKLVVRVLPFASFLVIWQCIYDQQDANFQSIAQQCDLRVGGGRNATQVPGAMLGLVDTFGCMLVIPFLDFVIFPALEKWRQRPASPYEKVLSGLVLAGLAMASTAVVEVSRRYSGPIEVGDGLGPVLDLGTHKPMNNLSVACMVPNYLLIAFAECLVNIPAYDIFYSNVPLHLKSTSQATYSFMLAMGDNLASIFTLVFAAQIPDDLNQGHLEYMYLAMAGVAVVNALGFKAVMTKMQFAMDVVKSDELAPLAVASSLHRC